MCKSTKFSIFTFMLLTTLWIAIDLYSRSNGSGISGLTGSNSDGCYCHTSSSSSATSLSVSSNTGSFKFKPGEEVSFTVSVTNSNNPKAGVNIAVKTSETGSSNAGTLSFESGTGLRTENGEITHSTPKSLSANKVDFVVKWTAPNTPGIYYFRAISNVVDGNGSQNAADQYNWLTPKQLSVAGLVLTAPVATSIWCSSTSQLITWTSTAVDNLNIELSYNGGTSYGTIIASNVDASTGSYSWSIPSELSSSNNYKVRISDASDASIKAESSLFSISKAPSISTQPQSIDVCEGSSATFTVAVNGTPSSYIWKKGNTSLSNSNSPSFTINNVKLSDAGGYKCVINSLCGDPIESNTVQLSVNESAGILQQPVAIQTCTGNSFTLNSVTKGKNKIVKWFFNNAELPNSNHDTLSINNSTPDNSGVYYFTVSADCGTLTKSNSINVIVLKPAEITKQPSNQNICESDTLKLGIEIEGGNIQSIQWQKDGQDIPSQTTQYLVIANAESKNSGTYSCIINDECSATGLQSNEVIVLVNSLPSIINHPQSKSLLVGEKLELAVTANLSKSFQWRKDGLKLPNENRANIVIEAVDLSNKGEYDCIITNDCGNIISKSATIDISSNQDGPMISLKSSSFDFGKVEFTKSKTMELSGWIKNSGNEELVINGYKFVENDDLNFIDLNSYPIKLAPNEDILLTYECKPQKIGEISNTLSFESNSKNNPVLTLSAFSSFYDIASNVSTIEFIETEINRKLEYSFYLFNKSNTSINLVSGKIEGNNSANFKLITELPILIPQSDSLKVIISFEGNAPGDYSANLNFNFEETDKSIDLPMTAKISPTSINEDIDENYNILAYPNPATKIINIKLANYSEGNLGIEIINTLGQSVYSNHHLNGSNISINLENTDKKFLTGGIYFIRIITLNKIYHLPIMIKE